MTKPYISVIMPTHNHAWEINFTLFSLTKQTGISPDEYEIIVINTNPEDEFTQDAAKAFNKRFGNIRFINVFDERAKSIKNATFGENLGARQYACGDILVLVVDSARIPTPGVLRKTRDAFERFGNEIVTTTTPYHFYKHSSTPGFSVEECREKFLNTRWKQDIRHLFDYAADTNISISGIHNESTYLGVSKEHFLEIGGQNEFFTEWSAYNLDLWRRLTRDKPKDNLQIPGKVNDHWGKIGIGLEIHVLKDEADFHLHHSLADANRDFTLLKRFNKEAWGEYEKIGDCIVANKTRPNWGLTKEAEEVDLS